MYRIMYRISADIPHGNMAQAVVAGEDLPAIHFSAHPHGGTEMLWWCFRLERTAPAPATVRLVWDHVGNCLGLGPDSIRLLHPVVRHDGGAWARLPAGTRRDRADGRVAAVWETSAPQRWLEVAFCFPHGADDVVDFARQTGWRHDVIGVSSQGREVIRVANDYGVKGGTRPGVYCVAHQHASEMSGAWALHGFLEEMARQGDAAPLVWSVPVTNVDGTVEGDYGKDPFPWDLNRAWGYPPMRTEVLTCMHDIGLWRSRCRPVLCLDFHSPGGAEADGCYTFLLDPKTYPEAHALGAAWADALAAELGEFAAPDFKRVATYPSRFTTEQHASFSRFYSQGDLLGMTFEIPYHRIRDRVLEIADYREIGRRMAVAVCRRLG